MLIILWSKANIDKTKADTLKHTEADSTLQNFQFSVQYTHILSANVCMQ